MKPVMVGDTLHVVNEVVETAAKGHRAGQVVWRRRLVNQTGATVQEGVFETLVARRLAARDAA